MAAKAFRRTPFSDADGSTRVVLRSDRADENELPDGAADVGVVPGWSWVPRSQVVRRYLPIEASARNQMARRVGTVQVFDYVRTSTSTHPRVLRTRPWPSILQRAARIRVRARRGAPAPSCLEAAPSSRSVSSPSRRAPIEVPTVSADFDEAYGSRPRQHQSSARALWPRWMLSIATPSASSYADPSPLSPTARSISKLAPGPSEPASLAKRRATADAIREQLAWGRLSGGG